jgi:hypothetical protein
MKLGILAANGILATVLVVGTGCREWMVGAPCEPETDNGEYDPNLNNTTYAIETRSVQCETTMCVTKTELRYENKQLKYSFCSCRCRDKDGHGYDRNSDKFDDLCECPPGTVCSPYVISNNIDQVPEALKGSYCIPDCIAKPCANDDEVCSPSSDSDEPWKWKCKIEKK